MQRPHFLIALLAGCAGAPARPPATAGTSPTNGAPVERVAVVRRDLEARYAENAAAFVAKDTAAVNRLRTPDYHTETPDGRTHSAAEMQAYTAGLFTIVERFDSLTFRLDSLTLRGDTAVAVTLQQSTRWQHVPNTPPAERHRVTVTVAQREQWVPSPAGWLLWRVDQVRDQRRWIDGVLQVPRAP